MTKSTSKRLRWLKAQLQAGRIPILRKPLLGAEALFEYYGVNPIETFIPKEGELNVVKRRKSASNKRYYWRNK